jgi:Protein of unknown function (DUF4236)
MGIYFRRRRSFLGNLLNVNLSKSGVGLSLGVRGFRAGISSSGRRYVSASLPGTGLYMRHYAHAKPHPAIAPRNPIAIPHPLGPRAPSPSGFVCSGLHRGLGADSLAIRGNRVVALPRCSPLSCRACLGYFHCVVIDDSPRLEGLFLRQKRFSGCNRQRPDDLFGSEWKLLLSVPLTQNCRLAGLFARRAEIKFLLFGDPTPEETMRGAMDVYPEHPPVSQGHQPKANAVPALHRSSSYTARFPVQIARTE